MEIALRCDDLDKLFTVDSDIIETNTLYMNAKFLKKNLKQVS